VTLRCGITTGTCAAAAAKAAVLVLTGQPTPGEVELRLPSGGLIRVPIVRVEPQPEQEAVRAAVRKDAGDDPDVTDSIEVHASVTWADHHGVHFAAGEGVGIITKPGLQLPPGEPAINPVPRRMIADAIREVTARGVRVEIAIPGGSEVARRTFNPRLGIEGGLSILGTTGIVRPYCQAALHDALRCTLDVAQACEVRGLVLVPGNIGARAARRRFTLGDQQVVEVGNEWRFVLDRLAAYAFRSLLIVGHPGKLAKLAADEWDTHSARSQPAVALLGRLCRETLGHDPPQSPTTDGLLAALDTAERRRLAAVVAHRVGDAVRSRIAARLPVAVMLVNMAGDRLGTAGDLSPWQ
jgi:cobalt-precorrin-5B (C1)-methyltransferase